jgi:hypothetical protein
MFDWTSLQALCFAPLGNIAQVAFTGDIPRGAPTAYSQRHSDQVDRRTPRPPKSGSRHAGCIMSSAAASTKILLPSKWDWRAPTERHTCNLMSAKNHFLLPIPVFRKVFRGKFGGGLKRLLGQGKLCSKDPLRALSDSKQLPSCCTRLSPPLCRVLQSPSGRPM